jgi:endonuclease/exonuclease/phosphatase family metal-dependent hydrolase
MTKSPAHPLRYRSLLAAVVTFLAVLLPVGTAQAGGRGHEPPKLTVMTRNLYLGADIDDVLFAPNYQQRVLAATSAWNDVLATDFRTRARALAAEVNRVRPDVLGLQEVVLWRDQYPSDILADTTAGPVIIGPNTPNARRVVFDFLAILRAALAHKGLKYTPVVTSVNTDAEATRHRDQGGFTDVRITDRDVILVRTPLLSKFSTPQRGHYLARFAVPTDTGVPYDVIRGWTSIDYRFAPGKKVRVFNTHLEVFELSFIRDPQAAELLVLIAASPHPVIALGDFNSDPDESASPTTAYNQLTAVLDDAWARAHPGVDGFTCCQAELLDNSTGQEDVRIDLILSEVEWPVDRVVRTGAQPFRSSPPPLWASDHFGVAARFTLR